MFQFWCLQASSNYIAGTIYATITNLVISFCSIIVFQPIGAQEEDIVLVDDLVKTILKVEDENWDGHIVAHFVRHAEVHTETLLVSSLQIVKSSSDWIAIAHYRVQHPVMSDCNPIITNPKGLICYQASDTR